MATGVVLIGDCLDTPTYTPVLPLRVQVHTSAM